MIQVEPPPYSAVVNIPNYCWKCGYKYDVPSSTLKHCVSCGESVIYCQQPMPMPIPMSIPEPTGNCSGLINESRNNIQFKFYSIIKDRLVIDFEKVACCPWEQVGLQEGIINNIPEEFLSKGISAYQWKEWMTELQDIQKIAPSVSGCLCMFCCPGLMVQSILCALFCPLSMNHGLSCLPCCYGDWYEKLRKWQEEVNQTFNHHGMHAKLMTYKPHSAAPRSKMHGQRTTGKDHNYEMSFLVIALNRAESNVLMFEKWDHGVNDGCTSGIGRCL